MLNTGLVRPARNTLLYEGAGELMSRHYHHKEIYIGKHTSLFPISRLYYYLFVLPPYRVIASALSLPSFIIFIRDSFFFIIPSVSIHKRFAPTSIPLLRACILTKSHLTRIAELLFVCF